MSQDVASGCSSFDQSLFEAVAFAREGGSPRLEQRLSEILGSERQMLRASPRRLLP